MPFEKTPFTAGADIELHRFFYLSAVGTALQTDATTRVSMGVVTGASREAPQDGSETAAAISGDTFEYRGPGDKVLVQDSGSGLTAGAFIGSHTDGKAIDTADGTIALGIALEAVGAGEIGDVLLISPYLHQTT